MIMMNQMLIVRGLLLAICLVFLAGCYSDEKPSSPKYDVEYVDREGFVHIVAAGQETVLGTSLKTAKANERPQLKVSFDYDYGLSRNMVTCGEYESVMKVDLECNDDSLPVTNVNFYEAVLFANQKSKNEDLDTAYTYTQVYLDESGRCFGLDGYTFLPETDGYRLPTEAEWVFAASPKWNPDSGWNVSNSDYKLHKVCSTGTELCDMSGNAKEWVNDWMGALRATSVADYVGAPNGGSIGEHVIKGGSFKNPPSSITLYGRGDVYTVTALTRADYVGFRLAFGKIPNPLWMSGSKVSTAKTPKLLVSSSMLEKITGTSRNKLAFRNDETGNLNFVNFSSGKSIVYEIQDTIDVYHPEISPDGKKVAFCTRSEGVPGKSQLYVRDLDESGANRIKLNVESAAIPRWQVVDGDTEIVYVSTTDGNQDEASWKKGSTWKVRFANGKFGTPQKIFDGTFNGGVSLDGSLAVSGARLFRARLEDSTGDAHYTVWYDSAQACNVSLSEKNKQSLFLDFGRRKEHDFIGERYGVHERLLVLDSLGKLIRAIPSPAGYAFDNTEWVHESDSLAVATLTNVDGAHQKIVVVNLNDSSVVEVAEGEELWHPTLWASDYVPAAGGLNLDSAGVYIDDEHALLSYKMKLFWKFHDSIEVALLGSSRMNQGIYPRLMSSFALNMSNVPNSTLSSYFLAANYVMKHAPRLKTIVVDVAPDLWVAYDSLWVFSQFNTPGFGYDRSHNYWEEGVSEEFLEAVANTVLPSAEDYESRVQTLGFSPLEADRWIPNDNGRQTVELREDSLKSNNSKTYMFEFERLVNLIELAASKNIDVVGLIFPQAPQYANTGAFGRHGMRRSHAMELIEKIRNLEKQYPNFHLMDENKMGNHDYTDDMAFDYDHLAYPGAIQLTERLDKFLGNL